MCSAGSDLPAKSSGDPLMEGTEASGTEKLYAMCDIREGEELCLRLRPRLYGRHWPQWHEL